MPCRYDPTPAEIAQRREKATQAIVAPYVEKLDALTRMLCSAMTALEAINKGCIGACADRKIQEHVVPEAWPWWEQHKLDDAARAEAARTAALAKLTDEDKKALGL